MIRLLITVIPNIEVNLSIPMIVSESRDRRFFVRRNNCAIAAGSATFSLFN